VRKRNGNALNTGNVQKLDRIPFDHFDFNLIGMSAKVGRSYTTFFWSSVTTGYAHFYRAMHSAVLRLHVVRLSVRLSVCDVGGSGSHHHHHHGEDGSRP